MRRPKITTLVTVCCTLALQTACLGVFAKGEEVCGDGADNDADGYADCEDSRCATDPSCGDDDPEGADSEPDDEPDLADEICDDGVDNDDDGFVDCDDSDCNSDPACDEGDDSEPELEDEICDDGVDNDGDDDVDCDDHDCDNDVACLDANPYSTYLGSETLSIGWTAAPDDTSPCLAYWKTVGTPREQNCPGCTFTFDVAFTYMANKSNDDGTVGGCDTLATDFEYAYALIEDYEDYGTVLAFEDGGDWVAWAAATWSVDELTYYSGYLDWYYAGGYGYGYDEYVGMYLDNGYVGEATVH